MNERLKTLAELIHINSVTFEEEEIEEYLKKLFSGICDHYDRDDYGNLYFRFPGKGKNLVLNGHMDTVPPCRDAKLVITDDLIKSDGTTGLGLDDKIAVAAMYHGMKEIVESGVEHNNITVMITHSEEMASYGIKQANFDMIKGTDASFVLDAAGVVGTIINQGPCKKRMTIEVFGKRAHAGFQIEVGINSIVAASNAISRLKLGRIDDQTVANFGSFISEGATNVVNPYSKVQLEIRSFDRDRINEVEKNIREVFEEEAEKMGAKVKILTEELYETYHKNQENSLSFRISQDCLKNMKIEPVAEKTLGGSDANVLNLHGIDSVVLTCGYHNAHSTEEYAEREQLDILTELVKEIAVWR